MFSLRLKLLLSCLCSKVRGELRPIVARLPGMEEVGAEGEEKVCWEAREKRDKFYQGALLLSP